MITGFAAPPPLLLLLFDTTVGAEAERPAASIAASRDEVSISWRRSFLSFCSKW